MLTEITRNIKREVERELWARTAGRCQFNGCNRLVYKSPVTQESVNISEKAHVYSFSENGPRGWGPFMFNRKGLNNINNLMLVCHDCHKTIDKEKDGGRYTAELLLQWKLDHEKRVDIATGIDPSKKSYVILYGANIGEEKSPLQPEHANWALFPEWYPAEERPISLGMKWEKKDDRVDYWKAEEENLRQTFDRSVLPLIKEGSHFSIFGLAPIPLLVRLGTLFTDKVPAQIYQLQREPKQTWQWNNTNQTSVDFQINTPVNYKHPPALAIALSSTIDSGRITSIMGPNVSIWKITIVTPSNDFLKTTDQLSRFRTTVRKLMVQISAKHGNNTPLHIFPSMPVAAAIELGRVRMPKAEMPWIIYDQNNNEGKFIEAIKI
jgi:hypothetical protein